MEHDGFQETKKKHFCTFTTFHTHSLAVGSERGKAKKQEATISISEFN